MSEMLTDTELSAIRARDEAATPGPWVLDDEDEYIRNVGPLCDDGDFWSGNDTFFVIHARTDIPTLLEHIDEQKAALSKAEADKSTLMEALDDCAEEISYARRTGAKGLSRVLKQAGAKGLSRVLKQARAALARVKGEA